MSDHEAELQAERKWVKFYRTELLKIRRERDEAQAKVFRLCQEQKPPQREGDYL